MIEVLGLKHAHEAWTALEATSHMTNDPEGVDIPVVYSGNERVMVGNGQSLSHWLRFHSSSQQPITFI